MTTHNEHSGRHMKDLYGVGGGGRGGGGLMQRAGPGGGYCTEGLNLRPIPIH